MGRSHSAEGDVVRAPRKLFGAARSVTRGFSDKIKGLRAAFG